MFIFANQSILSSNQCISTTQFYCDWQIVASSTLCDATQPHELISHSSCDFKCILRSFFAHLQSSILQCLARARTDPKTETHQLIQYLSCWFVFDYIVLFSFLPFVLDFFCFILLESGHRKVPWAAPLRKLTSSDWLGFGLSPPVGKSRYVIYPSLASGIA